MGDDEREPRETTEMDPDALRQLLSVEAREPRPTVAMRSDELLGLVEETPGGRTK